VGVDDSARSHLFERLVRDAQRAPTLGFFRDKVLESVVAEVGADSATLIDPPGMQRHLPDDRTRAGRLAVDARFMVLYLAGREHYDRCLRRLLRAMGAGAPIIDSEVYGSAERGRLAVYADVLFPQGARSLLCAMVHHRGRALCQVVLKRHGSGAAFRSRDSRLLDRLLPALALADAGFQHRSTVWPAGADAAPPVSVIRPLGLREAEVAALVCKGMRNREIALLIGTSCETVKKQVHSVFAKVGVSNRTELAGLFGGMGGK
jgi:DNA-binding CsgD family transcriptional regulator